MLMLLNIMLQVKHKAVFAKKKGLELTVQKELD